jgi:hypothetical protein
LDRYERELRTAGKARNTINTYLQHPERFINWLEGRYRPNPTAQTWRTDRLTQENGYRNAGSGGASRYDPLRVHLSAREESVVRLTFGDIERIIGGPLPASARRHRPWWANERSGSHVHAMAWMGAGRRTANVDLNATAVDFVR